MLEERELLKRDRFWNFFTMTSAITYGIGLVMFGCVFYLADIFISYEDATTMSAVRDFSSVARWQNLIPSFPWIAPGWRAIQGKKGIKFCSVA